MKIWKILFWGLIFLIITLGLLLVITAPKAKAATNISAVPSEHYAWNAVTGWFDFYTSDTVNVTPLKLTGYAISNIGNFSLDCATSPIGNICGQSNYYIANNNGTLSGYAWNDTIGWISFNGANYGVTIDGLGNFLGYAWNDMVGWISFNCTNPGVCGTSNYKVKAENPPSTLQGSLTSSVFDTQETPGAILNSIIWKGTKPGNSCVKFQIAVSDNNTGPWTFYGIGHDEQRYFGENCPLPNLNPIQITGTDRIWVNNKRFLRYKVFLQSSDSPLATPTVDEIILNWSR